MWATATSGCQEATGAYGFLSVFDDVLARGSKIVFCCGLFKSIYCIISTAVCVCEQQDKVHIKRSGEELMKYTNEEQLKGTTVWMTVSGAHLTTLCIVKRKFYLASLCFVFSYIKDILKQKWK